MMPVKPAITNWHKNAVEKSIGNSKRIFPPHMVASQLKIFRPVGTAISIVEAAKNVLAEGERPTVNIWCAQTPRLMKPIERVA